MGVVDLAKVTKRMGRPLKDPSKVINPDDLVTLGLQVSWALKAQLVARATAANRSLSQEVTMILEDALRTPDGFEDLRKLRRWLDGVLAQAPSKAD